MVWYPCCGHAFSPESCLSVDSSDPVIGACVIADLRARADAAEAKIQQMEMESSVLRPQAAVSVDILQWIVLLSRHAEALDKLKSWFELTSLVALPTLVSTLYHELNLNEDD